MNGWTASSLAEIAEIGAGNSAPQDQRLFKDGVHPFIRTSDVGQIRFGSISTAADLLNEEGVKGLRLFPKGTILMPKSGASTFLNHRVEMIEDGYVSSHLATVHARPSVCDGRFLLYYLSTVRAQDLIQDHKYPSLTLGAIGEIPVPLPPLDEQKHIVAVLDQAFAALDRVRANAEASLADVDSLQTAVVEGQFADRERWPKEPLGARVRFLDYRGRTPEKTESGVPLLTAKNVRRGYVKDEPREFIAREAYTSWMTRGIPKRGDVLFTTEAPLANVAQVETDEPIALAQRLITMQPAAGKIDSLFLKWSLMSPQMQADITEKGTGATVTGIKASLLKLIPLYVPDLDRQQQIADVCEAVFLSGAKLRNEIEAKLVDLAALRQSLLQAAFSGQLT